MQAGPVASETFGFSAKPKVVKPRTKYRETIIQEDPEPERMQNMMHEKRVVRGNTHARIIVPKDNELKESLKSTNKPSTKRQISIQKDLYMNLRDTSDVETPRALNGRKNIEVQTDEFVEMLTDKPPEYEKDTQTEVFIDRPNPRLFVPRKTGIDQETQIWDGDLFDFDYEVEPILRVLLGKTLEQSRMEVLEEEELRVMKEQQKRFEQLRNAELAEMQRLEAKEKRLVEEQDRRRLQYRKQKEQSVLSHKKMICRSLAKGYLSSLRGDMIEMLEDKGVFRDPLQMSLQDQFLPWLFANVQQELLQEATISSNLEQLCRDVVSENERIHRDQYNQEMQKRVDRKEAEKKRLIELAEKRERKRQEALRKIELDRRNKIRDDVAARLLTKAEVKEHVLQQLISDIDGNQQTNTPYIGLVGGLVGEFALFISSLANSTNATIAQQIKSLLKNSKQTTTIFGELLKSILSQGSVDLPVLQSVEAQLEAIQSGLTLATLATSLSTLSEEDQQKIRFIVSTSIDSVTLNAVKEVASQNGGISSEIIDQFIGVIADTYFANEALRQKIRLCSVRQRSNYEGAAGIALIRPEVASLPLHKKSEKNSKAKVATVDSAAADDHEERQVHQEQQQHEEQQISPEQQGEDQQILLPDSLAESEFVDKASVFVPKEDSLEVLVQHAVAEQVVRADILRLLAPTISAVEGIEFEVLLEAERAIEKMQKSVLNSIHNDFPVFDMSTY